MSNLAEQRLPMASDDGMQLLVVLMSMSRSCRQLMQIKLTEFGVMVGQDQLLDALEEDRAEDVSRLAYRLNIRPSTVSKMLDRIISQGWATREAADKDRRRTMVRLTAEGVEVQQCVRGVWTQMEDELCAGLKSDSLEEVLVSLNNAGSAIAGKLSRLR